MAVSVYQAFKDLKSPHLGNLLGVPGQLHTPPGASCDAVGGPASLKAPPATELKSRLKWLKQMW